jgi:hypothetical protein
MVSSAYYTGTIKKDKKINVWGCFGYIKNSNLYRIPGIMDRFGYNNILETQLLPSTEILCPDGQYFFQLDNGLNHTEIVNGN